MELRCSLLFSFVSHLDLLCLSSLFLQQTQSLHYSFIWMLLQYWDSINDNVISVKLVYFDNKDTMNTLPSFHCFSSMWISGQQGVSPHSLILRNSSSASWFHYSLFFLFLFLLLVVDSYHGPRNGVAYFLVISNFNI